VAQITDIAMMLLVLLNMFFPSFDDLSVMTNY